ncbi:exocyst subunit exo70 family protein C2 [Hibiscus trionum]|uniref:Exocyst subunit Exo70 family protein n=1 Tax=Hibiscus trionum TaxID=183268 RepID=A0A9W7HJU4_HIBTR|nr:exocyst subunit exo70 family protein C2 [Hibiscus trionum]
MFFFNLADPSANNSEADNELAKDSNEEKEGETATNDQTEKTEETETGNEDTEKGGEPEEPAPPPYTLETASEDMEHFLSNFSSILKEKEEDKKREADAKAKAKEEAEAEAKAKAEEEAEKKAEESEAKAEEEAEKKAEEPEAEEKKEVEEKEEVEVKAEAEAEAEVEVEKEAEDKEVEKNEEEPEKEKEEEEEVEDAGLEIPEFIEKYLDLIEEKVSSLESSAYSDTRVKELPDDDPLFFKAVGAVGQMTKLYDFEEKLESSASSDTRAKGYQLPDDDPLFFKAVGQMTKLYKDLSEHIKPESKQGPLINRISAIRHRTLCYLEEELRCLLEESRNVETDQTQEAVQEAEQDAAKEDADAGAGAGAGAGADQSNEPAEDQGQPPAAEESKFEEYSEKVLANITKIAVELITGGRELECCEVYMITRRQVLGETLLNLGYEKISIDEAQKMPWESLERDINSWIMTFKQCANVHLPAERKLVQTVFSDYPSFSDNIITNLGRCLFLQFLNFPEAVAFCKLTPEKLFKFLDMYEALRDNLSPINSVFPKECARDLRTEITACRCRIGEAAISIFCDLENSIKSDTGKTPVAGGAVHPLTRYIMNYLKYACEYKDTIEQVFKDHSKIERADSTSRPRNYVSKSDKYKKNDAGEDRPPFQEQLMRIMDLLEQAIDAKSKLYKDVALSSIFMMNNGRYMLQKIKGTAELYEVVGDNWCRSHSFDVRNYHKSYQRETWTKLLGCISSQGLTVKGKVVKPVLKEKFKNFNIMFDEIHRTQSTWVVYDKQLQSELRVSIASVVIPAYRSFLGRYSGYLDPGRQAEKYIKYQPEDIETYIDELFDGRKT